MRIRNFEQIFFSLSYICKFEHIVFLRVRVSRFPIAAINAFYKETIETTRYICENVVYEDILRKRIHEKSP